MMAAAAEGAILVDFQPLMAIFVQTVGKKVMMVLLV